MGQFYYLKQRTKLYKITLLTILTLCASCTKLNSPSPSDELNSKQTTTNGVKKQLSAQHLKIDKNGLSQLQAIIKTVRGNIVFKFYPMDAPNTVTRIIQLIDSGFYDGLIFHRVVPNFVIQGGDPTGTGAGGTGKKLKAEFNNRKHIRGTLAMARAQDPDSADSQFYIALAELSHLDEKYTVFGQVISGLNILDDVQRGDKILSITLKEVE